MEERTDEIAGLSVHWREAPARGGAAPVLYLHGVPTDGADWLPFLERTGGYAPDLPGFGTSDKPAHFDYSIAGYGAFLRNYVDFLELDRFSLVMHDFGALGLALAQAVPDRVERIVLIDVVPFAPGFRWHTAARVWRTPLGGELLMGFTFKRGMRRASHEWLAAPGPAPDEMIDRVWSHFDHGTQRAILKLYRACPPSTLATAGERLGAVKAPTLIVWGEDDPFVPSGFASAMAERLGGSTKTELVEGARHYPWLDEPSLVERIARFVQGKSG